MISKKIFLHYDTTRTGSIAIACDAGLLPLHLTHKGSKDVLLMICFKWFLTFFLEMLYLIHEDSILCCGDASLQKGNRQALVDKGLRSTDTGVRGVTHPPLFVAVVLEQAEKRGEKAKRTFQQEKPTLISSQTLIVPDIFSEYSLSITQSST